MFVWKEKAEKVQPGTLVQSWDGSFLKVRKVVIEVKVSHLGIALEGAEHTKVRIYYSRGGSDGYSVGEEVATLTSL